MAIERIIPEAVPGPRSDYSLVSVAERNRRVAYVSGQTGRKPDGTIDQMPGAQTAVAFDNLKSLLDTVDSGPEDVIHLRTYVVGRDALDGFQAARRVIFESWFDGGRPPSNTLAIVSGLADPDALVEIEAVVSVRQDAFDKTTSRK